MHKISGTKTMNMTIKEGNNYEQRIRHSKSKSKTKSRNSQSKQKSQNKNLTPSKMITRSGVKSRSKSIVN